MMNMKMKMISKVLKGRTQNLCTKGYNRLNKKTHKLPKCFKGVMEQQITLQDSYNILSADQEITMQCLKLCN